MIAKNELYLLESHVQSSEELTGKIRAAVGKAKLLLAQKFEQFAGLCRKNLVRFEHKNRKFMYYNLCYCRLKVQMNHFQRRAKILLGSGIW